MQIEPTSKEYRVWLSPEEKSELLQRYETEPKKKIALDLMFHGLRSEEVIDIKKGDIRRLDADQEAYKLKIRDGKTGYRECPLRKETREQMIMMANTIGLTKDDTFLEVSKRTIQRWIKHAAEDLAEQTDNEDWSKVSAHDARRTWATNTYYRLDSSDVAKSTIMRWGGWEDESTFEENYLGREPDWLAAELMEQANLI